MPPTPFNKIRSGSFFGDNCFTDIHALQAVIDALPYPIAVKDNGGVYLGCNSELELWLGLARTQLLGKTPLDIAPGEVGELCLRKDKEVLQSGQPCTYETLMPMAGGGFRDVVVFKAPLCVRQGDIQGILTTLLDVSDLKRTQKKLEDSSRFWKTVLDEMNDAVSIIDAQSFQIIGANRVFLQQFGVSTDQALGRRCHDIVFPTKEDGPRVEGSMCPLREAALTKKPTLMEHQIYRPGNSTTWLEISTTPILAEDGQLMYLVHVCRDVTKRKQAEQQIERLAYFDRLTDLPNRALLLDRLDQAVRLAQRDGGFLAVLFADIDHFKKINDSLGHGVGDRVLRVIANRLRSCMRKSDTLARIGGDEFVALFNSLKDIHDVLTVVQLFQDALSTAVRENDQEFHLETSIGVALFPEDSQNPDDLLRNAELAMHAAKRAGRNNYQFYSQQMNAEASERLLMESDLRRALKNEELFLVYQPQISLETNDLCGVEALLRWRHPESGIVSPAKFIPLAEETGLIHPMGEWVLREACRQLRLWHDKGQALNIRLSVNLSAAQFRHSDWPGNVKQILAETGIEPESLDFELTESVLMGKKDDVRTCLEEFQAMGIGLSLDDFGTGYSSLSYLQHFPINRIKIAQEFIREFHSGTSHVEIVKAIIAMANSLKLDLIAEGVETKDQLALLATLGCRKIQGYYFSRPLPHADFAKFAFEKKNLDVTNAMCSAGIAKTQSSSHS